MPEFLYTKDQIQKVMDSWGVNEPIPRKGKRVVINFPPGNTFSLASITRSEARSTYGKALYCVRMGNTLGDIGLAVADAKSIGGSGSN